MVVVCCFMLYFSIASYVLWFIVYMLLSVTESLVLLSLLVCCIRFDLELDFSVGIRLNLGRIGPWIRPKPTVIPVLACFRLFYHDFGLKQRKTPFFT